METTPSLQSITSDLSKRIKELECLYSIGPEIEANGDLGLTLRNSTGHLIKSLQYPEVAAASIWLDGIEYSAGPLTPRAAGNTFSSDIIVEGKKRGRVEAYYVDKAEFLPEERKLIKEVSRMISKAIERHELHSELQKNVRKLEERVEEKTWELEKSKKRYKDLFEDAPVPMLFSAFSGDIIKANRAFYGLLGYPEDGSVHLNFVKDKLYENPEARQAIYKKLREHGKVDDFELTLIDREGKPVPVLGSYIFIDIDGERCIESVYKDIQVRKELERKLIEQNENLEKNVRERTLDLEKQKDLLIKKNQELLTLTEKLRESKSRIQILFNAITDTVTVIDAGLNILMSNQKTIGNKGKCYKKVFNREQPCEDCLVTRVFEQKTSVRQEKEIDDGFYLLQAYPIFDSDGNVTGALEISRVITKEKNLERQLLQADKLASLGQLVSGIGHEINNPNTFIRGNLYIIQEAMNDIFPIIDQYHKSNADAKIARLDYDIFRQSVPVLIEDMVQGANRIKGIVDGLRKFAKKDEGLLNETVDLNAITEACLRLADNQIRRTADVKVSLDPGLPSIIGNSQKLQQVIVNILINASQAIDKQRGTIHVISQFNDKEVVLRVKDDGKGMDERTVKQIFDPFFTTKRHQGGTGLGLSIAYGIIKEHQGHIAVESKVGVGTTFCIYIPRRPEARQ
ncbi:MAG TPA: ATP-binding protein [Syntrophorhabdales bacterium]|nr:ATP-binding protein [Syntrophorhabdales bacterium]